MRWPIAIAALALLVGCVPDENEPDRTRNGDLLFVHLEDGRELECVAWTEGSGRSATGYASCLWPEQRRPM